MTHNSLKDAIRDALEPRAATRQPTALDIAQEAREAKASLESNMSCMARITVPAGSERHRAAFQLLRASMD
nr:hypothetical protein [Stenotrophomonas geniculata]